MLELQNPSQLPIIISLAIFFLIFLLSFIFFRPSMNIRCSSPISIFINIPAGQRGQTGARDRVTCPDPV